MPSLSLSRSARVAALAVGLGAALAPAAHGAEVLKLDLANPGNSVSGTQDTTSSAVQSSVLAEGRAYVITVSGTGSIWSPESFTEKGTCGVAESEPIEPSPGKKNSLAAMDAATIFAAPIDVAVRPLGQACSDVALPISSIPAGPGASYPYPGFEFALGTYFNRPVPVGGRRSVPRVDHTYSYEVVGKGQPARFRFADTPSTDNSGVLTIVIRAADETGAAEEVAAAAPVNDATEPAPVSLIPGAVAPVRIVGAATSSVQAQGERSCSRSSKLKVRLKEPKGVKFRKATFYVNGKKRRVVYRVTKRKSRQMVYTSGKRKGQQRTQTISGLPKANVKFKLKVKVVTTRGQQLTIKRTIPACSTKTSTRKIRFR